MIHTSSKIAIVAGNRLGDGLILNLIHYNLHLNGYQVTFYNSPLLSLKSWFPWAKIEPHFEMDQTPEVLKNYDTVIFQHPNRHAKQAPKNPAQQKIILYGEPLFMKRRPLLDIYYDTCKQLLNLPTVIRSNGIQIPSSLKHRKYTKRIIIHPETLRIEKAWPREKFFQLAKQLKEMGYEPHFVVSPQEESKWQAVKDLNFPLIAFNQLEQLAAFIYESAYMIGNDSGVAHLASNVNIPTFALFIRPGVAKRWQPSFSTSYPILPWLHLPGPKLKERFWKQLISVDDVLRSFKKVLKKETIST